MKRNNSVINKINSMAELSGEVSLLQKIKKPTNAMRNSMNTGTWATQTSSPIKTQKQ